jgi:4'-phosphopantetheinyl transferase
MLQQSECGFNLQRQTVSGRLLGYIEVLLLFYNEIPTSLWGHLDTGISAQENDKASRFVFVEDKRACVAAHWLKRRLLSRADPSIDPLSWNFERGVHGKPLVAGRGDLHFNLSHCKGLVACALRRDGPVGIDVEFTGRPEPREVALHYFSPLELAWWQGQPEAMKTKTFFNIWTMKEALVKATGTGLSQPFRDFSVCVESLTMLSKGDSSGETQSWRFHVTEPDHQHLLALAWHSCGAKNENVDVRIVEPQCLASDSVKVITPASSQAIITE